MLMTHIACPWNSLCIDLCSRILQNLLQALRFKDPHMLDPAAAYLLRKCLSAIFALIGAI